MSDGHNDRLRWAPPRQADVKDARGRDVLVNDLVWIADSEGALIRANVLDVLPDGTISLMTKSNSLIEVFFKPKSGTIPTCNHLLKD